MANDDEPKPVTTEDQFHRRYWTYTNRPYGGCGCLWLLLIVVTIYFIVSLLYSPFRFGYW